MVDRDLTPDEIEKEKKGFVEGEDCIDKMFTQIKIERWSKNSQK